jgi:hypothetical protein
VTVYTIVNTTVIKRKRDPEEKLERAKEVRARRGPRPRLELDEQVDHEFKGLRGVGRRARSTRR